jgi:argininosuccinate lyase
MPNKRNPDVVELLRAAVAPALGAITEMTALLSLPSGYQRDLQGTKGPLVHNMEKGLKALSLIPGLIDELHWNEDVMRQSISADMYATDRAVELTTSGIPFRDAYRQVGNELDQLEKRDPQQSLTERVSLGGPGNLGLDILESRFSALFPA